ncbi:MAG: hypothetical protein HYV04_10355, partial [Deltaproteobacteria bacterium]|nr:hypothetical protein [Deltaproteobacteria bacterium]
MKLHRSLPLTILIALTLAFAPAGAQVKPALEVAEAHLEAWRLTEAQEAGERLLRENSQAPEILDFNAWVMFYLGRYEDSLRYLEQALARDSVSERRQALRLFTQRTLHTVKKLKRFESAHFTVYLDDERDGILLPHIVDALERT